jgi:hypothetical protein
MFFRKQVPVDEYCRQSLMTLFSTDRELTWEVFRQACDDPELNHIDAQLYYRHLRAVFLELMLIAITQKCRINVSSDARVFVMNDLNERGQTDIDEISGGYNQAFGSSSLGPRRDGIAEMVVHFSGALTSAGLQPSTMARLQAEFYGMRKLFLDEMKSIRLISTT